MNTQNVNVNTATPESPKTWPEGQGATELSHEQFLDLYDFVQMNGTFTGISGVKGEQLARLDMLEEPTEEPEAAIIYLHEQWPVALYEYDVGYFVLSEALTAL